MHSVVNTLTFRERIDPELFRGAESLIPAMRAIDGFAGPPDRKIGTVAVLAGAH
jgi:hypothetical protein